MLIINPGANLLDAATATGWTNTYTTARAAADTWLDQMRKEGVADVDLVGADETEREGRWTFTFRHRVTGVEVEMETHGIDDLDAYQRQYVFAPRVYWRGCSSSTPGLSDFAAPGYVMTFRPADPAPAQASPLIHLEECNPEQHAGWTTLPYSAATAAGGRMCEGTQYMADELFPNEPVWVEHTPQTTATQPS
jgi:hypothetical protein